MKKVMYIETEVAGCFGTMTPQAKAFIKSLAKNKRVVVNKIPKKKIPILVNKIPKTNILILENENTAYITKASDYVFDNMRVGDIITISLTTYTNGEDILRVKVEV